MIWPMVIQYITTISGIPLGNVPGFTGELQAVRRDFLAGQQANPVRTHTEKTERSG